MIRRDSLKRQTSSRPPRPILWAYCEGKLTELSYFSQVKRDLRLANFEVKHAKGNPLDIVKYAIADPARPPEKEPSHPNRQA